MLKFFLKYNKHQFTVIICENLVISFITGFNGVTRQPFYISRFINCLGTCLKLRQLRSEFEQVNLIAFKKIFIYQ
jgi:hypothetical protein